LQDGAWSDQQLSALETEWSRVDFFKSFPNTIAYTRVSLGHEFEQLRRPKEDPDSDITLGALIKTPRLIPSAIKESVSMTWYRWANSYDDERNALIFLRDREMDLRRASQAATVSEMLTLPSVINPPALTSKRFQNYPASIRVDFEFFEYRPRGPGGVGRAFAGTLACAADAEIRRRIILTVIALERFKLRNSAYPEKLDELMNVARKNLTDFADGQPLRYHRTDDGRFLLYSIGLDCVDNRGIGALTNGFVRPVHAGVALSQNIDVLWPLPAHSSKSNSRGSEE
jgi:hypothetical protein